VTMLGDAAHAISPSLGRGANVALRDAARLGAKLIEVERGDIQPAEALRVYEDEMTTYGFGGVRAAAKKGALVIAQNPLPE